MHRGFKFRFFLLLIVGFLILRVTDEYHSTYNYSLTKRAENATKKNKEIHIAVVGNLVNDSSFLDGAMLAVEEVNKQGIELGTGENAIKSQLVVHRFDDSTEKSSEQSRLAIAANKNIIAVIGHSTSASAIPASISYEYNGILFLSTFATESVLTQHGFKYTFSTIPTEITFIDTILKFAKKKDWNKLVVLYSRNSYGWEFYMRLAAQLEEPIKIVQAKSFFVGKQDYKSIIYDIRKKDFDAVVLADIDENAANMIEQLRGMGVDTPIIGADGLDNVKIWDWSHRTAYKMYVASITVDLASSKMTDLIKRYKKKYDKDASYISYQGYEAVFILADALRKTGSAEPIRLASTLKFQNKSDYAGYVFDVNGLMTSKKTGMKVLKDGKFEMVTQE